MARKRRTCTIASQIKDLAMSIELISADPANARSHGEKSTEAVMASLRRFGQQKPIVIDSRGVVIAGNGTLEAAKQLGWTHIAAVKSDLAGADRTAYAIADNRTGELSKWNDDALRALLKSLPNESAEAVGFEADDLAELIGGEEHEGVTEDETPAPAQGPITRAGDLWILGEHRLLCGDSTDDTDVLRVMDGHKAALVSTDPPYLVDYTGVKAGGVGKDWSDVYREFEITDAPAFFRALFTNVLLVMQPNAPIYCWHAMKRISELLDVWRSLGILDHQQIVWVKPCAVFGSVFWHFRHEPCLMGWLEGSKPAHDGRHQHGSVWTANGIQVPLEKLTKLQLIEMMRSESSVWDIDWEGKSRVIGAEHPTQKPVEIFARPMRKHTAAGDICFEPFSGSGSQLVAAEQLKRRCFAIELEPVFVDVAVRRWQALTRKEATLEGDGRTWAEIGRERAADIQSASCPSDPNAPALTQDAHA